MTSPTSEGWRHGRAVFCCTSTFFGCWPRRRWCGDVAGIQAQDSYDAARRKFCEGSGNVIRQAEETRCETEQDVAGAMGGAGVGGCAILISEEPTGDKAVPSG